MLIPQVNGNLLKSVRWTGLIATEYDEEYTFFVTTHPANQVRVSVDNRWVVDRFNFTSIDLDGKGAPANIFNLQVVWETGGLGEWVHLLGEQIYLWLYLWSVWG